MFDLAVDGHVHTAYSAGRDSISVLVAAAEAAGLKELTLADRAGPETAWLPSYLSTIQRAQARTDVVLHAGIEVEAIGTDGWLAFPGDLGGLQAVSVAVGRLPMAAGLAGPDSIRALVADGALTPANVVDMLVTVTARAIERVSRYAPTTLARPLEFLTRAGIDQHEIAPEAVAVLADACRVTGTVVEVSERHRAPSARLARGFAAGGVRLVPASDARHAAEVAQWRFVRTLGDELAGVPDPVAS